MKVSVNTDKNIDGSDRLEVYVSEVVKSSLKNFDGKITNVEVFLKDENAGKSGANDKKCTIEVRPAGIKPIAVSHSSDHIEKSIKGSVEKAKSALENALGKLKAH